MIISVPKGSRIRYTLGGVEGSGTVFASFRRRLEIPTRTKVAENVYRVAERPDEEIVKEQIFEHCPPEQLKKDIVVALLGQDVLDNLQQSKEAVANANERPTFKTKRRRFDAQAKFTAVKIGG